LQYSHDTTKRLRNIWQVFEFRKTTNMEKRLTLFFDATPLALWEQSEFHRTGIGRMATQTLQALLWRDDVQVVLLCPLGDMEDCLLRFASACDWLHNAELVLLSRRQGQAPTFSQRIKEAVKQGIRKALAPLPSRLHGLVKHLAGFRSFAAYEQHNDNLREAVLSRMPRNGISAWFSCYQPVPACLKDIQALQKHVVLHDIIPLRLADKHPGYFTSRDLMRQHIEKADVIWANSQFTRQDFLDYFPNTPKDQVRVALHGGGEHFAPASAKEMAAARAFCGLPADAPYYMSLATLEPRKGLLNVIRAFSKAAGVRKDVHLVLVGQRGWHYRRILQACAGGKQILLPGFVPDAVISGLLSGCVGFVYMSEYEGFGLPVVEAMSCGAPVIAAQATALIEVTGDAAILLRPNDDVALADAMTKLYENPELREELRYRGKSRARMFSWNIFADVIVKAIVSDSAYCHLHACGKATNSEV
jgi:glycosyltransferase involved in cell wall biosynthesis